MRDLLQVSAASATPIDAAIQASRSPAQESGFSGSRIRRASASIAMIGAGFRPETALPKIGVLWTVGTFTASRCDPDFRGASGALWRHGTPTAARVSGTRPADDTVADRALLRPAGSRSAWPIEMEMRCPDDGPPKQAFDTEAAGGDVTLKARAGLPVPATRSDLWPTKVDLDPSVGEMGINAPLNTAFVLAEIPGRISSASW